MNYFSLFNLPVSFHLDMAALSKAYQTLSQLTHPDKFAAASESEKALAVQKNAMINDAYSVLKKPLPRAEHMLSLRGVELQHEQQTMQDPAFLMQQMEWREQLDEVNTAEDPLDALEELQEEILQQKSSHLKRLASLLEKDDESHNTDAADEIRKLKFLFKLLSEIENKEDALSF
ncbi:co-chaperone HscB [Aestuariibacter sp. AA17]|uniref:Co-chaperone protein HscB homolog n=1 Tax=Fluctibacter corallii TaxID=2984329 RepID=A0ABT3ABR7_9ALTE|nr:co-chaperone HscB [Aestuariibacter sp. AA17]MCV2886098.1 co-chaperone HscB [Aestuariibacter sp. AA17]